MSRAIITAAGKASRFHGLYKELLPATENKTFLELNIEKGLCICNEVALVTNPDKVQIHYNIIEKNKYQNVKLIIQTRTNNGDLFEAVKLGQNISCDNVLIMADTYFESKFQFEGELSFGIFNTLRPERFSTLINNRIYTKMVPPLCVPPFPAWGSIYWNSKVANTFNFFDSQLSFDAVLNECIKIYGYSTFKIEDYFDIGTFERYKEFLKWIK